jgi:hypothetical protein
LRFRFWHKADQLGLSPLRLQLTLSGFRHRSDKSAGGSVTPFKERFMRLRLLVMLIAASLCSALLTQALSQTKEELAKDNKLFLATASKTLKWEEPTEPFKVVGPIYFVGTKGLGL